MPAQKMNSAMVAPYEAAASCAFTSEELARSWKRRVVEVEVVAGAGRYLMRNFQMTDSDKSPREPD